MANRRIVAIMFADIAGYTSTMQTDERQATSQVQKFRSSLNEIIGPFHGELIQFFGDGSLTLFSSAFEAVQAAVSFQKRMQTATTVPVRIGIHLGEVIHEEENVYGDAVNVASRIEALGVPGAVLISGKVYGEVRNQPDILAASMGKFAFKHVVDPVELFALNVEGLPLPSPSEISGKGPTYQIDNSPPPDPATSSLNILIVEDDMLVGTHISMVLQQAGYKVSGIFPSGESALEQLKVEQPDLILMDINLKGKLDGVDTAQLVYEQHQIPVIFLTANTDKATFERAKLALPYAFIAKPFKPADLTRAVELVVTRLAEQEVPAPAVKTNQPSKDKEVLKDRIFVRDKDKMVKVAIQDIHYVEAERNYCRIFTEQKAYILSVPLKSFETRVNSDIFVRVHRSFLVNLSSIDELDDHYVYCQGQAIPVSKAHKATLSNRLQLL